jgi:hypothetical protein
MTVPVNVFDEGDGLPAKAFFERITTAKDDTERPFTLCNVGDVDTYTHAAFVTGNSPRATMRSVICRICCALPGH